MYMLALCVPANLHVRQGIATWPARDEQTTLRCPAAGRPSPNIRLKQHGNIARVQHEREERRSSSPDELNVYRAELAGTIARLTAQQTHHVVAHPLLARRT